MASGASVGKTHSEVSNADSIFSERSKIKLALALGITGGHPGKTTVPRFWWSRDLFSSQPTETPLILLQLNIFLDNEDLAKNAATPRELRDVLYPNAVDQLGSGQLQHPTSALVIQGSMKTPTGSIPQYPERIESDQYRFSFKKGEYINAESISFVTDGDDVITGLKIVSEEDGSVLCENLQDFETFDPVCLDVEIPSTGTYVIEVFTTDLICFPGECLPLTSFDNGLEGMRGTYELLVYSEDRSLANDV